MSRPIAVLLSTLCPALACSDSAAGDCDAAVDLVLECYGQTAADAFASSCDADAAAQALAEPCAASGNGKADFLSTEILSPPVEHFRYGSIGNDQLGLPAAIVRAVPIVCADTLPPGTDPFDRPLEAFGMIYEPGEDLPIGFSRRRLPLLGITLTGTTCSACHTATVRETPMSDRVVYYGAPNTRFDVEAWSDFLFGCIADSDRFNAGSLDRAFDDLGIGGFDRLLAFNSGFVQIFTEELRTQVASVVRDGPWGPGRDDAIGLAAAVLLGEDFLPTVPAPVDFPSAWNQAARTGHGLHWDGGAPTAFDRNVLVSVGTGTPADAVPFESIDAIQAYLDDLAAPRYPFAIDDQLAARGSEVFEERCDSCHGPNGSALWDVVPVDEVGTDPNRALVITDDGVDATNALTGAGWEFTGFSKTDGYVNSLLDGIWLRAPYLHNGSVPTLRDLLSAPEDRPKLFFRGNDTYDQLDVGFVSDVESENGRPFTKFDATRSGDHNTGHVYGTDLSNEDKDALLEYLKTL